MHNRIYCLAKIEFASFVDASLSRGSLHIVRRPLKSDVPILVCENSREPATHVRRNHIRFCKRYSSIKRHFIFVKFYAPLICEIPLLNKYTPHVITTILESTRLSLILIRNRIWFLCIWVTISQPLAYGSAAPQDWCSNPNICELLRASDPCSKESYSIIHKWCLRYIFKTPMNFLWW